MLKEQVVSDCFVSTPLVKKYTCFCIKKLEMVVSERKIWGAFGFQLPIFSNISLVNLYYFVN